VSDAAYERTRDPLLEVKDLRVTFRTRRGRVAAVDGLSFAVAPGEVLGIVGESGSGKSVSMMSVLGLIRDPNATVEGQVLFRGQDLVTMRDRDRRSLRGRDIGMIFQDPMTSLTPVYNVGWHIIEQIRAHESVSKQEAKDRAIQLLDEVGIPNAARRVDDYPHEFSGGMRQRVVIAMALSCNPGLLIADEPTTALDVTTQAQILALMRRLREVHGSSIIFITHDMGVISEIADRVLVMYAGRSVEQGPKRTVFRHPAHPYTWGLLGSVPRVRAPRVPRLATIPGSPPSPLVLHQGCAFAPRCRFAHDRCVERPPLAGPPDHVDACWLPKDQRDELRRAALRAAVAEGDPGDTTGLAADVELAPEPAAGETR